MTDHGYLVRIEGKDADAIGETPDRSRSPPRTPPGARTKELAWEQLKTCFDPEIPVNIVDLGLVYKCEAEPVEGGEKVQGRVHAHRARLRHGRLPAPGRAAEAARASRA